MIERPNMADHFRCGLQWIVGFPVFFLLMVIVLVASLFIKPYKLDPLLRIFSDVTLSLSGIRFRVTGMNRLLPGKAYLFVFNHTNIFDHFVLFSALRRPLRGVEREDHFKWPLYGWILKRIGQIPIPPRGATSRALQSLDKAKVLFEKGISVAIAPEGTRSPNGELLPFKKGAFHLAIDLKAELVPLVLKGAYQVNRKGDWHVYPGIIDLYIEEPILCANKTSEQVLEIRERARSVIASRLTSSPTSK